MTEIKTNITDSDLLTQLQSSYIKEEQKKELISLIPNMTGEERMQLVSLIERSNTDAHKIEDKYDDKMRDLNKEYDSKLDNLNREQLDKTAKEIEKFDKEKSAGEFKEIEAEIETAAKPEAEISVDTPRTEIGKAKKHTLRRIMFFFILLGLIAAGILYGLQYLNTL